MNQTTVDGRYLAYCETEKQSRAIKAIIDAGSVADAAINLGIGDRALRRMVAKVKRSALAQGDHLLPIERQTIVHRNEAGQITHWDKGKASQQMHIPLYQAMQDGIDCKLAKPSKLIKGPEQDLCSVLTIADQHIGMLAYGIETGGDDWSTDIAVDMLLTGIDALFPKTHKVKHGVLLNLGDLIHFDGMLSKTNQSNNILDSDTRPGKVYRAATAVIRYAIDRMLQHCETLEVMNVRGNHDESSLLWLNTLCQHVYANEPRILPIKNNDCKVMTHTWEGNFIYAYHGDGLKPQNAYNAMTRDHAQRFADARYVWMPSGHLHNEQVKWIGKAKTEIITTLAPVDAWHASHGYGSHREMRRTDLHPLGGKVGGAFFNPALHTLMKEAA